MNDQYSQEELLEFPCQFPIKTMGRAGDALRHTVVEIIEKHSGPVDDEAIRTTPSRNGRFVSLTITIEATSRAQLDDIYQDLTDADEVLFSL